MFRASEMNSSRLAMLIISQRCHDTINSAANGTARSRKLASTFDEILPARVWESFIHFECSIIIDCFDHWDGMSHEGFVESAVPDEFRPLVLRTWTGDILDPVQRVVFSLNTK